MADNTELNAGTGGDVISTDDIAGVKVQRVKIQYGVDGAATDVSDSNPLPIDDAGGSITVDNVTLSITGGGTETGALRVTLANDSTGVLSIDDNGGSITVDNAGTFAVQIDGSALTSLQLLDDVVYVDDAAGFTPGVGKGFGLMGYAGPQTVDSGDMVMLACTTTGILHVNEANSSAILADTANIDTNVGTIAGAVSGTEMQVDIVASLPAGTNAIGKLAANSGVDIGDVDVTSISAGSNLIGDVGISGARTSGGTTLYKNIDVDETEDQIKATGGQLYWLHAMNLTASVLYLQVYNATAASVTVGTTTPDLTFPLPTQGDTNGAGFVLAIPNGIAFSTAITIACTTTATGSSGPAANGCFVNAGYA